MYVCVYMCVDQLADAGNKLANSHRHAFSVVDNCGVRQLQQQQKRELAVNPHIPSMLHLPKIAKTTTTMMTTAE